MRKYELLPGVSLARLTPPPVSPAFIPRERLLARLETTFPHATFLVAPSGYGKSVLAAQWVEQHPANTFWYTVEQEDTARLSSFYFIEGIRRIVPDFAPWAEKLREKEFDPAEIVIRVANEMSERELLLNMVFDQADKFGQQHGLALQAWTDNAPMSIRTLSLRRTMQSVPNISYARAEKLEALDFFGAEELKFSPEEIQALAAAKQLNYADSQTFTALEQAHGWPAGVNSVALGLARSQTTRPNSVGENYHVELALEGLSKADHDYLENISLFDVVTVSRANKISKGSQNGFIDMPLMRMAREGLFVDEVAPSIYRINPLIQGELRKRLASNAGHFAEIIEQSTSALLEENNFLQAVELLTLVGEEQKATKLAVGHLAKLLNSGDTKLLRKLKSRVAPHLVLGKGGEFNEMTLDAFLALLEGEAEECLTICHRLERAATEPSWTETLTVELWGLRARSYFTLGDFESVYQQTSAMLSSTHSQGAYGSNSIKLTNVLRIAAGAAFLSEDLAKLSQYFTTLQGTDDDDVVSTVINPSMAALMALAEGRYKESYEFGNLAISNSKRLNISGVYAPFDAAYCVADFYREKCEEERAVEILDEYIVTARKFKVTPWIAALLAKKARVKTQQGEANAALLILKQARESIQGIGIEPSLARIIDEQELFVRVSLGDTERIQELLFRLPDSDTSLAFKTTYAAMKAGTKADEVLAGHPEVNPRQALSKYLIAAEVNKANSKIALKYLDLAIAIAAPAGVFGVFLAQTEEVKNYILEIANKQPSNYLESLSGAIRQQQLAVLSTTHGLSTSLTKRELDILRRLSSGLPISQIAQTLHISQNTIKTHLKSVYRKLNADSRDDAVQRGRELLLI